MGFPLCLCIPHRLSENISLTDGLNLLPGDQAAGERGNANTKWLISIIRITFYSQGLLGLNIIRALELYQEKQLAWLESSLFFYTYPQQIFYKAQLFMPVPWYVYTFSVRLEVFFLFQKPEVAAAPVQLKLIHPFLTYFWNYTSVVYL